MALHHRLWETLPTIPIGSYVPPTLPVRMGTPSSNPTRSALEHRQGPATPDDRRLVSRLALLSAVPAKAGTHFSAVSGADRWVPAFAGTPIQGSVS